MLTVKGFWLPRSPLCVIILSGEMFTIFNMDRKLLSSCRIEWKLLKTHLAREEKSEAVSQKNSTICHQRLTRLVARAKNVICSEAFVEVFHREALTVFPWNCIPAHNAQVLEKLEGEAFLKAFRRSFLTMKLLWFKKLSGMKFNGNDRGKFSPNGAYNNKTAFRNYSMINSISFLWFQGDIN